MAQLVQIQMRRDSAADWTSNNPTLAAGEWGYETDTGQIKIGTGSDAWAVLGYFAAGGGGGGAVDSVNGATGVVVLDADDIDDAATTNKFATAGQLTKVDYLTVTQAVDLDAIETRVNALDAAVVLQGAWDASSGSFPGAGAAQAGDSYIVSVGGTVDSIAFTAGDRIIAITDAASTSTFDANWFKADYTDAVNSINGLTGAVTGVLFAGTSATLTVGYVATAHNGGTVTTGTFNPAPANGNLQRYVNGGAHTLAAPDAAGDYTIVVQVSNDASAGAITFSGFTLQDGDSLTTTDGHDFLLFITKLNGLTHCAVKALQ